MDRTVILNATWEDGGIRSDGTNSTAYGIRTRTNYIEIDDNATALNVSMITGYAYAIYFYDNSRVKISSISFQTGTTANTIPSNTKYVRLTMRKGSGSDSITVAECEDCEISETVTVNIKYGIDVSYYQLNIDWEQVAYNSDKEFAIIRAGYGANNIDLTAVQNCQECNRLSFPIGLYWFSYAYTIDMARLEGEYVSNFASHYNLDLPIYWDFEYDSRDYAQQHGVTITAQLFHDMANAFCTAVEDSGYTSGLYYNPDFDTQYNIASFFQTYPNRSKFIAKWGSTPPDDFYIWQYGASTAGEVAGISTQVDLDLMDDGSTPTPPIPPVPPHIIPKNMPIWFYLKPF